MLIETCKAGGARAFNFAIREGEKRKKEGKKKKQKNARATLGSLLETTKQRVRSGVDSRRSPARSRVFVEMGWGGGGWKERVKE